MMKHFPITKVSEIRNEQIFNEKLNKFGCLPGFYKWWAEENFVQEILFKLEVDNKEEIVKYLEKKDNLFCIYVGITTKRTVKERLKEHIFKHSDRLIKNNFLSTFRKTIASIFTNNMRDINTTNKIIDSLFVEYFVFDEPEESSSEKIKQIEKEYLKNKTEDYNNKLYILNIDLNKHPFNQSKKLRKLRKESREKSLKEI